MRALVFLCVCAVAFANPFNVEEGEVINFGELATVEFDEVNVYGTIICEGELEIKCEDFALHSSGEIQARKLTIHSKDVPTLDGAITCETLTLCPKFGKPQLQNARLQISDLIIDPKNILVQSGGVDSATGNTFGSNPSSDVVIDGATLSTALDAASVTLQANTDITIDEDVTATTAGNNLTLQAGRSITINSERTITLNGGDFSATINDEGAQGGNRDAGDAVFLMSPSSSIVSAGGDVTIDVGAFGTQSGQVQVITSNIDAAGGNITITGVSTSHQPPHGVVISESTLTTDSLGTLDITGVGGSSNSMSCGIDTAGSTLTTEDGTMTLHGTGGGIVDTGRTFNYGMRLFASTASSTGSGGISMTGIGGSGSDKNYGLLTAGTSTIDVTTGTISLTGTGGGSGEFNFGAYISGTTLLRATSGDINITGTGGPGVSGNSGVIVSGNSTISLVDGNCDIQGTGQGLGSSNYGVVYESDLGISITGSGNISITGDSSTGDQSNTGILVTGIGSIEANQGTITFTGQSHGTGNACQGVNFANKSMLQSVGTGLPGAITISGTGGTGSNGCFGFSIYKLATITSVDADITVNGTSQVAGTSGLDIQNENSISSQNGTVETNNL